MPRHILLRERQHVDGEGARLLDDRMRTIGLVDDHENAGWLRGHAAYRGCRHAVQKRSIRRRYDIDVRREAAHDGLKLIARYFCENGSHHLSSSSCTQSLVLLPYISWI